MWPVRPWPTNALSLLHDGQVLYALKHRWRDGTTHVAFEPLDFVARLAALVPPPRFHGIRYHGVLAPAARLRAAVVPEGPPRPAAAHPGCTAEASQVTPLPPRSSRRAGPTPSSAAAELHAIDPWSNAEYRRAGSESRVHRPGLQPWAQGRV